MTGEAKVRAMRGGGLGIVIFDMDGTLVDSFGLYTEAFSAVLSQSHGISPAQSREVFLGTAGMPLDEQFSLILADAGTVSTREVHRLVRGFWGLVEDAKADLLPGVADSVRALASAGYSLVVSSGSTPAVVARRIEQAGLTSAFRLLLGSDYESAGMAKGPDHFKWIRRELGISLSVFRRNSVMVGDGPHDVFIAKQAGIISIAKIIEANAERLRHSGADFFIHDLTDLLALLSGPRGGEQVFLPVSELVRASKRR